MTTPRRCPACLIADPQPGHHCIPRAVLPLPRPELTPRRRRPAHPNPAGDWSGYSGPRWPQAREEGPR